MAKYTCTHCKKKTFSSPFSLTRHIERCRKDRPPGKEARCPECKDMFRAVGIGSHRRIAHGVIGTSRESLRKRAVKAVRHGAVVDHGTDVLQMGEVAKNLLEQAKKHQELCKEHAEKAVHLTRLAAKLKKI